MQLILGSMYLPAIKYVYLIFSFVGKRRNKTCLLIGVCCIYEAVLWIIAHFLRAIAKCELYGLHSRNRSWRVQYAVFWTAAFILLEAKLLNDRKESSASDLVICGRGIILVISSSFPNFGGSWILFCCCFRFVVFCFPLGYLASL